MFGELLGERVGTGELEKEGHVMRSWKRRYFELRGDTRPPVSPGPPLDKVLGTMIPKDTEEGEEIVVVIWSLVYYRLYGDAAIENARGEREVRGTLIIGKIEYEPGYRELKAYDAVTGIVYLLRADSVGEARRWAAVLKAAGRGLSPEDVASAWHRTSSLSMDSASTEPKYKLPHNRSSLLSSVRAFRARRRFALDASRQSSGSEILAARLGHKLSGGRRAPPSQDIYARVWLHALTGIPKLADVFLEFYLIVQDDEDDDDQDFDETQEKDSPKKSKSALFEQRQRSSTSKVSKAHRVEVARWVPAEAFTFRLDSKTESAKIVVQVRCRSSEARRTTGMIAGATVGAGMGAAVGAGVGAVPGAILGACVGADESLDSSSMQQTQSICDGILSIDVSAEKAQLRHKAAKTQSELYQSEENARSRRFVTLYDPKTNAPAIERGKHRIFEAGQINTEAISAFRRQSGRGEIAAVLDLQILDGTESVILEDFVWEHERKTAGLLAKQIISQRKDKSKDWSHSHLNPNDPKHYASLDYSYHGTSFAEVAPRIPPGFSIRQNWHLGTADSATDEAGWRYAKHFPKLASREASRKLIAELVSRGAQGGAGGQLWWDQKATGGLNTLQANVRRRVWCRELVYLDPDEDDIPNTTPTDAEICNAPMTPTTPTTKGSGALSRPFSLPTSSFSEKNTPVQPPGGDAVSPTSFSEEHHSDDEERTTKADDNTHAMTKKKDENNTPPEAPLHSLLQDLFQKENHLLEASDDECTTTGDEEELDDELSPTDTTAPANPAEDKLLQIAALSDTQTDFFDDEDEDDEEVSLSSP